MQDKSIILSGDQVKELLNSRTILIRTPVKSRQIEIIEYQMTYAWPPKEWEVKTRPSHGKIGERYWVKETWQLSKNIRDYETQVIDDYEEWSGPAPKTDPRTKYYYGEPWKLFYRVDTEYDDPELYKWQSPSCMPRWASRVIVEVCGINFEKIESKWFWARQLRRVDGN